MKKQSGRQSDHGLALTLSSTASTSSSNNTSQGHYSSKGTRESSHGFSTSLSLPSSSSRRFRPRPQSLTPDDGISVDSARRSNTPMDPRYSTSQFTNMSQRAASPDQMSPRSSISSNRSDYRKQREHTHRSNRASTDYRRYNGTVNHYGRHSNDWLFGGFSLRDTVRDGVDKLRHHGHGKEG